VEVSLTLICHRIMDAVTPCDSYNMSLVVHVKGFQIPGVSDSRVHVCNACNRTDKTSVWCIYSTSLVIAFISPNPPKGRH